MIGLMSCRAAAQNLSAALEGEIGLLQRLGLRFHLRSCPNCSRLRGQLSFLRAVGGYSPRHLAQDVWQDLKPELRESIEQALKRRDSLR